MKDPRAIAAGLACILWVGGAALLIDGWPWLPVAAAPLLAFVDWPRRHQ